MAWHVDEEGNWVDDGETQSTTTFNPGDHITAAPPGYVDNGDGTFTDPMTKETVKYKGDNEWVDSTTGAPAKGLDASGNSRPTIDPSTSRTTSGPPGGPPGGGGGTTIGGGSSPAAIAAAITAALSAHALNKTAGDYTSLGEKYAGQLDPYGAYRKAAADKLAALQADPTSIQDTPGYKFSLQQQLGAVANRDNRQFGVGAGSTNPDLMNYAQGLASKTYNDTIAQLSAQAGVGISPSAAASALTTGMQGSLQARLGANASLGAIPGLLTNPTYSTSGTGAVTPGASIFDRIFGGGSNQAPPGSAPPPVNLNNTPQSSGDNLDSLTRTYTNTQDGSGR